MNIFKRNTDNNDAGIHIDKISASRGMRSGKIMLLALLCTSFLTPLAAFSANRIAVAVNGDSNDCAEVGGKCHGGYVYCLGKNCHSLPAGKTGGIIAPTDLITSDTTGWQADTNHDGIVWGGYKIEVGVSAQNANNGSNNTGAIYTALTAQGIIAKTYATGICHIYTGPNGTDRAGTWYLPAINELMRIQRNVIPLNAAGAQFRNWGDANGYYWSSTEEEAYDASILSFTYSDSEPNSSPKDASAAVRCVKAF